MEDWYLAVNPDEADARARLSEIEEVQADYMSRIAEFDHVLLNTTREEDMYDQMFQLLEHYCRLSQREGRVCSSLQLGDTRGRQG